MTDDPEIEVEAETERRYLPPYPLPDVTYRTTVNGHAFVHKGRGPTLLEVRAALPGFEPSWDEEDWATVTAYEIALESKWFSVARETSTEVGYPMEA